MAQAVGVQVPPPAPKASTAPGKSTSRKSTGADPSGRRRLIKYAWIEKSITAFSVTWAFTTGGAMSHLCFYMVLFTDYLWIPLFLYWDVRLRGNPLPANLLADARRDLGIGTAAAR